MKPLEPIRVSLSTGTASCGCCITDKVTIFRGDKKITFDVCPEFAAWFQLKYPRQPRQLTRVWRDLESVSWMDWAMFNIGGEVRAIFEVLITTGWRVPCDADHIRRCLSPDLVEALVAEKLDTM